MRTIKFRAWDNLEKRMITPDVGEFGYVSFYGSVFLESEKRFDVPYVIIEGFPNTELMQFTGLKDKNGKDIYEGDMCRFKTSQPPTNKIGEIDFNDSCFWFVGSMEIPLYGINERDIEIIGNIYENPELIK